ncbi:MAG: hypothetical protein HOP19_17040 [Acidobacteria bacterium]|nr:hypothetical protein [Acidobacteriota bacterium]
MEQFWTWFGRVDNVFGVVGAIIGAATFALVWRQERRLRAQVKEKAALGNFAELRTQHAGIQSATPVAFALSLIPTSESIKGSVRTFLTSQQWDMPIEELNLDGLNSAEDLERFINALREKRRAFDDVGYTEIHLFIAGPVQAGTIIGSLFRNWIPVKLYHKPNPAPPQVYEYWMPLL